MVLSVESLQVLQLSLDDSECLAHFGVLEVRILLCNPVGELGELDIELLDEVVDLALSAEGGTKGFGSVLLCFLELEPYCVEFLWGKSGCGSERRTVVQTELGLESIEGSLEITEGCGVWGLLCGLVVFERIELFLS